MNKERALRLLDIIESTMNRGVRNMLEKELKELWEIITNE